MSHVRISYKAVAATYFYLFTSRSRDIPEITWQNSVLAPLTWKSGYKTIGAFVTMIGSPIAYYLGSICTQYSSVSHLPFIQPRQGLDHALPCHWELIDNWLDTMECSELKHLLIGDLRGNC